MFLRCNLRWACVTVMVAGLTFVPAASAEAQEEQPVEQEAATEEEPAAPAKVKERNWRVRFQGAVAADDNGIIATSVTGPHTSISIGGGVGAGINFEYRYSPRMGFEMGAMALAGGVYVGAGKSGYYQTGAEVGGYMPLTFALNYHPIKKSQIFDFYVGPLLSATLVNDIGVGVIVNIESRVDLGLGANLGFDINLGNRSRWSLGSGLKYIANVTSDDRDSQITFDPLIWTFGFGVKF